MFHDPVECLKRGFERVLKFCDNRTHSPSLRCLSERHVQIHFYRHFPAAPVVHDVQSHITRSLGRQELDAFSLQEIRRNKPHSGGSNGKLEIHAFWRLRACARRRPPLGVASEIHQHREDRGGWSVDHPLPCGVQRSSMLAPLPLQRRRDLLAEECETISREITFADGKELPLFESDVTLQQGATGSKAGSQVITPQNSQSRNEGMQFPVLSDQAVDPRRHVRKLCCDHREERNLFSGKVGRKFFTGKPQHTPALFADIMRPAIAEESPIALLEAEGQRESMVMLPRQHLQCNVSFCHSDGSSYIRSNGVRTLSMAKLDLLLLAVFGVFAVAGLAIAFYCFRRSLKVATDRDGDVKMFFWAVGGLLGLIIAGMSSAYILLPILLH